MSIKYVAFNEVDLNDKFFNSLKADYAEFSAWFAKKGKNMAYVSTNDNNEIDGFLYLKYENDPLDDVDPVMSAKIRLKVGTFKIDAHGTKLGDRFIKKLFDYAMKGIVEEIYVTIFEKHEGLIKLLSKYGFRKTGTKTTPNGTELVLTRSLEWGGDDLYANYPLVRSAGVKKYLLALYPDFHTKLLPDSKLITEGPDVISDVSSTNSVRKIYLAGRTNAANLKHGDLLIIYRTTDNRGPAFFRSVATSLCVVDEIHVVTDFKTEAEFLAFAAPVSVFTEVELKDLYKSRKYPIIITFLYNVSFPKRVTRKVLIEEVGLDPNERWACLQISDQAFKAILDRGKVDAHFVVD